VSRATVSYVLNDTPHQKIPEATRQRVLEAAARLGYAPSAAARALRSGRSDVVLCLLPDWPIGPAVGDLLSHLSGALAGRGLTLLAHPRARDARPVSDVWKAITPAAVLAFDDFDDGEAAAMRAAGIELTVALFGRSRRRGNELELPEQRTGRLQTDHLAARGHRRLGYGFPDDERVVAFARPRLAGVRARCAELGLSAPVVRSVPLDPAAAEAAVRAWRAEEPAVTAVCAYNDDVALAVLAGTHRLGLHAPGDLAVIGVDDIPAAALAIPPLSTVALDAARLGEHVAQVVLASLAGTPRPRRPGAAAVRVIARESA